MTVWIVTRVHDEYGAEIEGVFATEEAAIKLNAKDDSMSYVDIEEYEVEA